MLCQKCQKKEANYLMSQNIDGVEKRVALCSDCAKEEGYDQMAGSLFHDFGEDFFSFGGFQPFGSLISHAAKMLSCPTCGFTQQDVQQLGRVGCADCYDTFQDLLDPAIRRVQRGRVHQGKVPKGVAAPQKEQNNIAKLEAQLQQCIKEENFEQAAKIRDELKQLREEK